MFSVTSSSLSSINYYFKHRLPRYLNLTDDYISSSTTNRIQKFDISYEYNTMKDVSSKLNKNFSFCKFFFFSALTKTQIKVIITVVFIISFIMLIIAIFRFK